jgi:hypothetical protein
VLRGKKPCMTTSPTGRDEHYAQELDDPAALDPDRIALRREIIAPPDE